MLAGAVPALPGVPGDEACACVATCTFAVYVLAIPLKVVS